MTAYMYGVSFMDDENILSQIMVLECKTLLYTRKKMKCTLENNEFHVCELQLNKKQLTEKDANELLKHLLKIDFSVL